MTCAQNAIYLIVRIAAKLFCNLKALVSNAVILFLIMIDYNEPLACAKCGYRKFYLYQTDREMPDGKITFELQCIKCRNRGDAIQK